jgi:hypothetical protein
VPRWIVSLTNFTEPSARATLTPPGWRLLATVMIREGGNMHDRELGGPECQ